MSASQQIQSIGEVIHKESTKENKRFKRSKALSHKDRVAHMSRPKITDERKKVSSKASSTLTLRSAAAELNCRIDEYLVDLLMRDLIDEEYWKFHTKCMHQLGLARYNLLVIESVDGRNPKHLLAYKLKGALELDAKKQQYRDKYELQ